MNAERLAELRKSIDSEEYTSYLPKTVRELLDHIAQLEAQRGGAVVVPSWNRGDFDKVPPEWSEMQCFGAGYDLAVARIQPIPASQVLQPGEVAVKWISVSDQLPEDGETVGFITECSNDRWYHGRVLGGRYRAGEFGGFSVPGLTVQASHWFRFPAIPDALRAQAGGEG